jgi:heterodisulfide reductase subunit A
MAEADHDVLVIGGGIAGQECSLNLADMGFKVLLVERDYSIGGKMIQLSKVFPTLDCSACIATPKMSETARHENITILTNSEVADVSPSANRFRVRVQRKPRYVVEHLCTGCQECEQKCPVDVHDQYNYGMVGRKAVYIPFNTAIPRVAVIDIDNCILCGACEKVCPADAIDFTQELREEEFEVSSIIIATGFSLFHAPKKKEYGYGRFKNVIHAMEMDRLLSPTRAYNTVLRPRDGKIPENIAYVLCTGSRDTTMDNPICSQVCCMYSIKQAQLLMGALPLADITLYYIDIRAFGKGFEEFYQQAKDMGVQFVKGKIAQIAEREGGNLLLSYEDIENGGRVSEAEHDLVVLSVGIIPGTDLSQTFTGVRLERDRLGYVAQPRELTHPGETSIEGVFVAGTACGPMDIPDSILSAGAASSEAASYMRRRQ